MIVMDKAELEKLKLEIGQKIDLFSKEVGYSPHNVVFDGIKEYNDYGASDIYILYHRVESVKLEDVRKIVVVKPGEETSERDVMNNTIHKTTDNTNTTTESPTEASIASTEEQNKEQNKEQETTNETNASTKKYECSCGKVYSHYASWYQHAKKTGHAKKE
jgi:hypothetical protein